jgi:hypothetical protein
MFRPSDLVINDVMDAQWLAEANRAIDIKMQDPSSWNKFNSGGIAVDASANEVLENDGIFVPPKELSEPDCSERLFGDKPSVSIAGDALMAMAPEHSAPFKKMIGHPAIVRRFNWMLGEGWYMNCNVGGVAINPPGCVGLPLHASGYADPGYYTNPGRPHSCKLNYGWQLAEVNPGDGGFALIPGELLPLAKPSLYYITISSHPVQYRKSSAVRHCRC